MTMKELIQYCMENYGENDLSRPVLHKILHGDITTTDQIDAELGV
jgi:hypothetical protein